MEHPGMDPASRLLRLGCGWDVDSRSGRSSARMGPRGWFVALREYWPSSCKSRKAFSEKNSSMFSIIVMIVEDSLWAKIDGVFYTREFASSRLRLRFHRGLSQVKR